MTTAQKKLLEKQLWAIADLLRGKMNADEYKNYILGLIFYKHLSEIQVQYANTLLESDGKHFTALTSQQADYLEHLREHSLEHLGFFLAPTELFAYLTQKAKGEIDPQDTFILDDLQQVLSNIEHTSKGTESEDDFSGLFSDMDLSSNKLGKTEKDKNTVIGEVMTKLAEINFQLDQQASDILGDAYEYLIGEFAAGSGKKGGEFYTPSAVSDLLARIVTEGKTRIRNAYDPTCGSGSLLLKLRQYAEVEDYFGQELNPTTYNLARMNMILHGIHFAKFSIKHGNTLSDDQLPDLRAEAIVANPPFSAKWKSDTDPTNAQDPRFFEYGKLAPKSAADYAFVTHMLHHLADNGTMAVVMPHGALFRGGAEGVIRRYIIERQNYLDAVIGLPANLFYGTSIPATILVFKKCRPADGNILFIDASKDFEKGKNQNTLLPEHIAKIFKTYTERKEVEKYAHVAPLSEIAENDYNLNIPRYVDTFEEEEPVDIAAVATELKQLQSDEKTLQKDLKAFCDDLDIDTPF